MRARTRWEPWHVAVFFVCAMAFLIFRSPDAAFRPQFWAEDGAVWYAQAHEIGPFAPFLKTQDGYFSTYLRVVASLAQPLPLAAAPLFFALIAFALQAAPAAFFLSERCSDAVPDRRARLAMAALYLAMPNTAEIHGNATNAQWYLALLACLVVLARPSATKAWRAFDALTLVLAGLSGPYALFLAPLAAIRWRAERDRARGTQTVLLAACGVVQLAGLFLVNKGSRLRTFPVPDAAALVGILGKQVFGGAIFGMGGYALLAARPTLATAVIVVLVAAGTTLVAYGFARGPWQLRHFIAFAAACFAAALALPNLGASSNASPDFPAMAWHWLFASSSGSRYWFPPMLAWLVVLAWGASRKDERAVRAASVALLLVASVGFAFDLRDPSRVDTRFASAARRFAAAPDGTRMTFELEPRGWTMALTKK